MLKVEDERGSRLVFPNIQMFQSLTLNEAHWGPRPPLISLSNPERSSVPILKYAIGMTNFIFSDVDGDKSSGAMHASPMRRRTGECVCVCMWAINGVGFSRYNERRVGVATLRPPPLATPSGARHRDARADYSIARKFPEDESFAVPENARFCLVRDTCPLLRAG